MLEVRAAASLEGEAPFKCSSPYGRRMELGERAQSVPQLFPGDLVFMDIMHQR